MAVASRVLMFQAVASALFAGKRKTIDEVMASHRADVLSGEAKAAQRMARAYQAAERSIRAKLARVKALLAAAEGQTEEELATWLFQDKRYTALLDQIYQEIDAFSVTASSIAEGQQSRNGNLGAKNAGDLMKMEVLDSGLPSTTFTTLNKRAVENMVGVFADGSPLRSLFGKFGNEARNTAHDILVSGMSNGTNPRQLGRELFAAIEEMSLERATTIAREESLRVLTTSQQRTYDLNSDVITGSRIVSALDGRTCPMCWARHGTILKPGQAFSRHVMCRCALAPITAFSRVRATGPEEFAQLTKADQLHILGPARFKLYQEQRLDMKDLFVETSSKWGPGLKYKKLDRLPKRAEGSVAVQTMADGATSVVQKRKELGILAK